MPRNFNFHKPSAIIRKLQPFVQKYFPYHKSEVKGTGYMKSLNTGAIANPPYDLAIGQVFEFKKQDGFKKDCVRVLMKKLCINRFLFKYFYQDAIFWAHKNGHELSTGDIVLVKKADVAPDVNVVLTVEKVVFAAGKLVDPVSGLPSRGDRYGYDNLRHFDKNNI